MDKQWEADRFGSAWAVYEAGSRKSPDRIAFVYVVETSEGNPSDKITKAHADLIATAPELLAACVEAFQAIRDLAENAGDMPEFNEYGCAYEANRKLEAAISKAKGVA